MKTLKITFFLAFPQRRNIDSPKLRRLQFSVYCMYEASIPGDIARLMKLSGRSICRYIENQPHALLIYWCWFVKRGKLSRSIGRETDWLRESFFCSSIQLNFHLRESRAIINLVYCVYAYTIYIFFFTNIVSSRCQSIRQIGESLIPCKYITRDTVLDIRSLSRSSRSIEVS